MITCYIKTLVSDYTYTWDANGLIHQSIDKIQTLINTSNSCIKLQNLGCTIYNVLYVLHCGCSNFLLLKLTIFIINYRKKTVSISNINITMIDFFKSFVSILFICIKWRFYLISTIHYNIETKSSYRIYSIR